jgi:hypothetical protein
MGEEGVERKVNKQQTERGPSLSIFFHDGEDF